MSHPIHVNLFIKGEMRSAAPVRLRVVASVAAGFLAGLFAVLALVLRTVIGGVESSLLEAEVEKERLSQPHKDFLTLKTEMEAAKAGLTQLGFFRTARLEWGTVLGELPRQVPASVQFLELRHFYPPFPQSPPGSPLLAPTNRVETGRVVLNGRTTDSDSVASLLEAFHKPPLDALLVQAKIPPGAFRQEPRRQDNDVEALLFEVDAVCPPRRFE